MDKMEGHKHVWVGVVTMIGIIAVGHENGVRNMLKSIWGILLYIFLSTTR